MLKFPLRIVKTDETDETGETGAYTQFYTISNHLKFARTKWGETVILEYSNQPHPRFSTPIYIAEMELIPERGHKYVLYRWKVGMYINDTRSEHVYTAVFSNVTNPWPGFYLVKSNDGMYCIVVPE